LVCGLSLPGQEEATWFIAIWTASSLEVIRMLFNKIVELAKAHGWKQQTCGMIGISGSIGTNFYKDGQVLSISIVEEGHMTYPDNDELKEMFVIL
jgi:hypothetical protein